MLRTTIEIEGLKKAEFNILENDYDTGATNNYDSETVGNVGKLTEPKEELSAESVILFDGTTENSSSEPIAQISNVIFGDVVYDETQLETDLSDGMYHGAECGVWENENYNMVVNISGLIGSGKYDRAEHLASSATQSVLLEEIDDAPDIVKAYRYMNRVESKVVGKSIAVILDGYKL